MTLIIIILIIVAIVFGVFAYNNLVSSRMHTSESLSQIDVQLKRRNDLIPNLVNTVKGYADFEKSTLTEVTRLRTGIASTDDPQEKMDLSNKLSKNISGIFAVAENYPDLKASENFVKLQEELTNTENKIGYSRQLYNSTVSDYNTKIQSFPSNIIAKMFHFKEVVFLNTPEEEKEVPKVEF